jgi:preprotein translocase subunit SecD
VEREGAHLFQQITTRNLQKPLAIAIDQAIISTPTVSSVISNRGQIEGNFTIEEARIWSTSSTPARSTCRLN